MPHAFSRRQLCNARSVHEFARNELLEHARDYSKLTLLPVMFSNRFGHIFLSLQVGGSMSVQLPVSDHMSMLHLEVKICSERSALHETAGILGFASGMMGNV